MELQGTQLRVGTRAPVCPTHTDSSQTPQTARFRHCHCCRPPRPVLPPPLPVSANVHFLRVAGGFNFQYCIFLFLLPQYPVVSLIKKKNQGIVPHLTVFLWLIAFNFFVTGTEQKPVVCKSQAASTRRFSLLSSHVPFPVSLHVTLLLL